MMVLELGQKLTLCKIPYQVDCIEPHGWYMKNRAYGDNSELFQKKGLREQDMRKFVDNVVGYKHTYWGIWPFVATAEDLTKVVKAIKNYTGDTDPI